METPSTQTSNTTKVVSTVIALALIIFLVTWFMKKDETAPSLNPENTPATENTPTTENTPNQNNGTQQEQPAAPTRRYSNGSFNATGNYVSPAGVEEVAITLIIKDDKIASASFEGKATNSTSQFMQGKFSEGFEATVVGKSIDEVSLTVVNGSSLTPKGFMDALQKIKAEAKNS